MYVMQCISWFRKIVFFIDALLQRFTKFNFVTVAMCPILPLKITSLKLAVIETLGTTETNRRKI